MNKYKDEDMNKDKDNDQDKDKAGEQDKKKGADLVPGGSSSVWVLTGSKVAPQQVTNIKDRSQLLAERPSALFIFSFCRMLSQRTRTRKRWQEWRRAGRKKNAQMAPGRGLSRSQVNSHYVSC